MNKEDIENLAYTDFDKMQIIINRIYKEEYVRNLEQENKELHNKIDKAIEYLINPPKKIWEGHSIDEVVRILKDSDVDEL